ncbi:MAG: leucine-rich repeat domain-containing protein, partial [Clostridia bacterium]|nr:leucine-rich repeat domain-containing protein [Clostridia bacterium]
FSVSGTNHSVTAVTEAVITRGMALKADERFATIKEFWEALQQTAFAKAKPPKGKPPLVKMLAIALSVTLAGGVLAYFVPRTQLWQQVFGKPQPAAGSGGVEAPRLPTAIPEPVMNEPTAAPTENPYARLFAYYVQSDDTIFIEQYIGSDPEVEVPATIDGFKVTVIGHEAFRNCGDVTSVTLPDGLTELGTYAFAGCRNLKELAIPASVHTIGPCAFNECVLLEHLVSPEGVALIEDLTFYNCASLKTVTIPESVITIDQSAFSGETHPTLIVVPGSYGELFAQRNRLNYRTIASATDFEYSTTADGGICIDKYIGTADKVMIPDTIDGKPVRQIGPSAFYQCAAIREIVLPDSINAIGEHAFSGCSLLSSINIPEGVEVISNRTFSDCTSINAITLPQSLYTIGDHAFSGCSNLGSITLPENLSHIGQFAFSGCSDLTSIMLPQWISCLMDGTFSGCTKLASITFPEQDFNMISHQVFTDCTNLTELNLPAALEFIGDDAFSGCTG